MLLPAYNKSQNGLLFVSFHIVVGVRFFVFFCLSAGASAAFARAKMKIFFFAVAGVLCVLLDLRFFWAGIHRHTQPACYS